MSELSPAPAPEHYISHPLRAIQESISRVRARSLGPVISIILIMFAIGIVSVAIIVGVALGIFGTSLNEQGQLVGGVMSEVGTFLLFLFTFLAVLGVFVIIPFMLAFDYIVIRAQSGSRTSLSEALKRGYKRCLVAVPTYIISGLFVLGGLILFIVPGIYIALRLSYINSIVANENLGPIASIKRSFALTEGDLWDIIGAVAAGTVITGIFDIAISLLSHAANSVSGSGVIAIASISFILSLLSFVATILVAFVYYFRYHQSTLEKADTIAKEGTHRLNYVMFVLAIILSSFAYSIAPDDQKFMAGNPNWTQNIIQR